MANSFQFFLLLVRGNFATVWRCARRHDKFAAAVKILRKRENEKEVLARETEILRTVNHPNCVRLLGT